jgi:small nuclear ribonucleoprotein (snRNP)-like protein
MLFYSYFKTLVGKEVTPRLLGGGVCVGRVKGAAVAARARPRVKRQRGVGLAGTGARSSPLRVDTIAPERARTHPPVLARWLASPASTPPLLNPQTAASAQVTVELKNDLAITGVLHSVDQYLNIKLTSTRVVDEAKHPHMVGRGVGGGRVRGGRGGCRSGLGRVEGRRRGPGRRGGRSAQVRSGPAPSRRRRAAPRRGRGGTGRRGSARVLACA